MSISETALPAHWQYYSDRAHEADVGAADHFGSGREEQLWETLKVIESGEEFNEACRQRLDRIPQNRAKKHLRLLQAYSLIVPMGKPSEEWVLDLHDEVVFLNRHLSAEEQQVEARLVAGETYSDIVAGTELSVAALKVRASRWRERLRKRVEIVRNCFDYSCPSPNLREI